MNDKLFRRNTRRSSYYILFPMIYQLFSFDIQTKSMIFRKFFLLIHFVNISGYTVKKYFRAMSNNTPGNPNIPVVNKVNKLIGKDNPVIAAKLLKKIIPPTPKTKLMPNRTKEKNARKP